MLTRLLEQMDCINAVLHNKEYTDKKKLDKLDLHANEWTKIKSLIKILEPYVKSLQALCADIFVTISLVRPLVYYHLMLAKPNSKDTAFESEVKAILAREVKHRFKMQIDYTTTTVVDFVPDPVENKESS
jgi:hypothetical protein